jgi:hypothetical protein
VGKGTSNGEIGRITCRCLSTGRLPGKYRIPYGSARHQSLVGCFAKAFVPLGGLAHVDVMEQQKCSKTLGSSLVATSQTFA